MHIVHTTTALVVALACAGVANGNQDAPIPVVFDTDIGTDFDDSAALALAVQDPRFDVKLVVTATGDVAARARIVARYLERLGRDDIPIGLGVANDNQTAGNLYGWASSYNLSSYAGGVFTDGAAAMANVVRTSPHPVTIIAIAPADNFPSLLSRFPDVVTNAKVAAMSGSIYRGYNNSTKPTAEYNVRVCPECTAAMYAARWLSIVTTPLDTCGTIALAGDVYMSFLNASSAAGTLLAESYVFWSVNSKHDVRSGGDVWYDTVAAALVLPTATQWMTLTPINVTVTSDGHTVVDPHGSPIMAALNWTVGGEAAFAAWEAHTIATPAAPQE